MDEFGFGVTWAEWLVKKLNGKGNVIMVTGVAGTYDDEQRNKGADRVWAKNPGIKVVARYTGNWDTAASQTNTAAILPTLPKIDGIWCQSSVDGVLKAFVAANRVPLPPTAGTGENGFRKFMMGYMGQKVDGISYRRCAVRIRRRARTRARGAARHLSEEKHQASDADRDQRHAASRRQRVPRPAGQPELPVHRFRAACDRATVHRGGAERHAVRGQAGGAAARVSATRRHPPTAEEGTEAVTRQTIGRPGEAKRPPVTAPSRGGEPIDLQRDDGNATMARGCAVVECSGISKSFGGVQALDDAALSAAVGEVHALVGENGAGKSTLIKALGGRLRPDAGDPHQGPAGHARRPQDAHRLGVWTVFQELTLFPWMSVAENLLIAREPRSKLGLIDRGRMEAQAEAMLAGFGIEHIDPLALVEEICRWRRGRSSRSCARSATIPRC